MSATQRSTKPSASSWIREHMTPGMVINKQVIAQLAEGAREAGFPCSFAGASSCVYTHLKGKKNQRGRSVATTAAALPKQSVGAAGLLVSNIVKEFDVLQQEVKRLQRIEEKFNQIMRAVK